MASDGLKILHLSTNYLPIAGGIERFIHDLAAHSQAAGLSPSVLCFNRADKRHPVLPANETIDGVHVQRLPFWDLVYYKPAYIPLRLFEEADILHVHGLGFLLDYVAATRQVHGKPIVVSTHGGIAHTARLGSLKTAYTRLVARRSLAQARCVAACSLTDYAMFERLSPGNLKLIENGVDVEKLAMANPPIRQEGRFLFVGRLTANKNLEAVIRTFAEYAAHRPGATLRVVGDDWQNLVPSLERQARARGVPAGRIQFLGVVTERELAAEYHSAQYFISASRHEGFGISAVEAMACGTIVLLSRIAAFERFVPDDGYGLLLDFQDAQYDVRRLLDFERGDLEAVRQRARTLAAQYGWKRKMPEWLELYDEVNAMSADRRSSLPSAAGR